MVYVQQYLYSYVLQLVHLSLMLFWISCQLGLQLDYQLPEGLLHVVGMPMLLMYMPLNKYWSFLIVGFVLAAYLSVPTLGIGAVGLAAAYEVYKKGLATATAPAGASFGGELEDE